MGTPSRGDAWRDTFDGNLHQLQSARRSIFQAVFPRFSLTTESVARILEDAPTDEWLSHISSQTQEDIQNTVNDRLGATLLQYLRGAYTEGNEISVIQEIQRQYVTGLLIDSTPLYDDTSELPLTKLLEFAHNKEQAKNNYIALFSPWYAWLNKTMFDDKGVDSLAIVGLSFSFKEGSDAPVQDFDTENVRFLVNPLVPVLEKLRFAREVSFSVVLSGNSHWEYYANVHDFLQYTQQAIYSEFPDV